MNKIHIAVLVFVVGFSIALILALGKKVDPQWYLLFPTAAIGIFAYRHFSDDHEQDTELIGIKGGRSRRNTALDEHEDDEEE